MNGEPPTNRELAAVLAELSRKVDRLEWRTSRDFTRAELYTAHRTADLAAVDSVERRVTALEDRLRFVGHVALTGIILPICVGVLVALILAGIIGP